MNIPSKARSAWRRTWNRKGTPWGNQGFPYTCGVTRQGFMYWATVPGRDGKPMFSTAFNSETPSSVGTVLRRFCADCEPSFQAAARNNGTCIRPLLEQFRKDEGNGQQFAGHVT